MIRAALLLALLVAPAAARADTPSPALSLEHRMLLRCAAAFAVVAVRQREGGAAEYPAIEPRGREYFVRASAQVMDEAGLDRAAIGEALAAEVRDMVAAGTLAQVMPVCLAQLPAE